MPEALLDHERLDVYKLARELARTGNAVLQQVPPGRSDLIDQFRRAALSVALNIAEGAGEFAPKEKTRFYRMAKRSSTECAATLDHLVDLNMLHAGDVKPLKTLIHRIVSALVKLILSTEKLTDPRPPAARDRARELVRAPAT